MKDVKDLLDDSNYNFLSYTAFITKYKIKTNYLEYYKVVSALKHFRKKCSNNQNFTTLEKATDNLFSSEKVCETFYQIFIKRKTSSPVKSQEKWLAGDLFSNVQVNWRVVQYFDKFMHGIVLYCLHITILYKSIIIKNEAKQ